MFHEGEMKDVRAGDVLCMQCTLDMEFLTFLGEILDGEHKELMAGLRERFEREREEEL